MISNLVITQLVENTAGGPGLLAEHGVAFLIEADEHHLLFDTGQGMALAHNVTKLAVRMDTVEAIILSHGHYDHAGGLEAALALTGAVDLYLHPAALEAKFNRNGQEIGAGVADVKRLASLTSAIRYTPSPTEILPGIHVTGEIPRLHTIEDTGGPFYRDSGCARQDNLPDDQALVIETTLGLVVLLGCGHSGVANTLDAAMQMTGAQTVHAVIGGMHLLRSGHERLIFTGHALQSVGIQYLAPNHCTGLEAVCYFRNRFAEAFHQSPVGTTHRFRKRQ
jgi:7,8-dihydropterin-6-yl-methyl-4-(beta-D-ribofuranosyl)aminobenzene 5'-phosphate synthase